MLEASRLPSGEQIAKELELSTLELSLQRYLDRSLLDPLVEYLGRPQKRIRGQMVVLGAQIGLQHESLPSDLQKIVDELAFILEMVHSGSLIVDDIQDGSPTRRGQPALHKILGVPKSLNAGNWLYFFALRSVDRLQLSAERTLRLTRLFHDCLFEGHVGQALDLGVDITEVPRADVGPLCRRAILMKTGCLTELAMGAGYHAVTDASLQWPVWADVARSLGMALQMFNDLINLGGGGLDSEKHLEDFRNGRPGLIWMVTAELESDTLFAELVELYKSKADTLHVHQWVMQNNIPEKALQSVQFIETQMLQQIESLNLKESFHQFVESRVFQLFDVLRRAYAERY